MQTSDKLTSILLADDDKDDRFFFREAFKEIEAQAAIETVSDGEQLIVYLSQPGISLPEVIFLDLNLPRKNGLECLEDIRSNKDLKDLLIIIYSTSSSERDISESFQKGANMYIRKPSDYFSLTKIITKVIEINWHQHNANLTRENFLFKI